MKDFDKVEKSKFIRRYSIDLNLEPLAIKNDRGGGNLQENDSDIANKCSFDIDDGGDIHDERIKLLKAPIKP